VAQRGLKQMTCSRCNITFPGRKGQRYCSRRCSAFDRTDYKRTPSTFAQGNVPWNKGLKNWRHGYRHSAATIEAMRQANSGENAPMWKGGVTEVHYRLRRSSRYADWRRSVFERDGYVCQTCRAKSTKGCRVRLEADHIKPFATFPELRFDVANGRTLCAPCHRKTETWGQTRKTNFTGQTATRPDGTPYQATHREAVPAN